MFTLYFYMLSSYCIYIHGDLDTKECVTLGYSLLEWCRKGQSLIFYL